MERNELALCQFCGALGVTCREVSTFRWVIAECDNCGATAGEVRKNTLLKDRDAAQAKAESDAIAAWNTRAAPRDVGVTDAFRELVEACEAEFGCDAGGDDGELVFEDQDKVAFPEAECHITFGHIRRARAALSPKAAPSGDEG